MRSTSAPPPYLIRIDDISTSFKVRVARLTKPPERDTECRVRQRNPTHNEFGFTSSPLGLGLLLH